MVTCAVRSFACLLAFGCRPSVDRDRGQADTATDRFVGNSTIPLTDGYAVVAMVHRPQGDEAYAGAQFWVTHSPPGGQHTLLPDALGACASLTYTSEPSGDGWQRTIQSAGPVTFRGPSSLPALDPQPQLGNGYYGALDAASFAFASTWDVSALGSAFPAFDLLGDIEVPGDVILQFPGADFVLESPFDLRWSGGDPDVSVTIRITATDIVGVANGRIVCEVPNDGAFSVPAPLIAQMPPGVATAQVEHLRRTVSEVDGRAVRLEGVVSTLRVGTRP
jgi:hypothetical protein